MPKKQNISTKIVVGASGSGTTFEAIAKAVKKGEINAEIAFLFVDRECGAIERAKKLGIEIFKRNEGEAIADFHQRVVDKATKEGVKIIALCGYLRLFPVTEKDPFIVLNSHPGKIPEFGGQGMYGIRVHEAVLKSGAKETFSTVHIASAEYDRGPVLGLKSLLIKKGETPESLASRLLPLEHQNYIEVIKKLVEKSIF